MKSATYTKIEHGTVYLGNDQWERQWSNFMGNTLSIFDKRSDREWVQPSPEFRIEADTGVYTHFELGYTEWHEHRDSMGAGVVARHRGEVFELEIENILFHNTPGTLRRYRLFNVSAEAQTIQSVALECLKLESPGAQVYFDNFETISASFCQESTESALAICDPMGGLILGIAGGGKYELFQPDSSLCSLVHHVKHVLEPGKQWVLPETLLLPFAGKLDKSAQKNYAALLELSRQYRHWEQEREQDRHITPGEEGANSL